MNKEDVHISMCDKQIKDKINYVVGWGASTKYFRIS